MPATDVVVFERALSVRKMPPSLPRNSFWLVVPLYCGWKRMAWLSAWAYCCSKVLGGTPSPLNHQKEVTPQLAPPSSERKTSVPPAQTTFSSVGSTASTLSYQP